MKNSVIQTLFILIFFLQLPNLMWGQYTLAFECPDCSMKVSIQPDPAVLCEATLVLEANVQNAPSESEPTFLWSDGTSTANIDVTSVGVYSVTVSVGTSCSAEAEIIVEDKANPTDIEEYLLANGFYKTTLEDPVFRNPEQNGKRLKNGEPVDMQEVLDYYLEENSCIESNTNSFVTTCVSLNELEQINNDFNKQETGFWIHQIGNDVYIKSQSPNKEPTNGPLSDEEKQGIEDKLAILEAIEWPGPDPVVPGYFVLVAMGVPIPEIITTNEMPNISLPLVVEPPVGKNINTIEWFIEKIKKEEAKVEDQGGDCRNTKEMITKLRKIFYTGGGWESRLILGTDNIPSPYGLPIEEERGRKTILSCYGSFDLVDIEKFPCEIKISEEECLKKPEIYDNGNQQVTLTEGNYEGAYVDIGHVLAGLDAVNNNNSGDGVFVVDPVFGLGIDNNVDAVTWVGDLASSMVDAFAAYFEKGNLTDEELQMSIVPGSSPQDMLGNMDAYVIGYDEEFNIGATINGPKVSEILESYYLGKDVPEHFDSKLNNQNKRFSIFAEKIGLIWDPASMSFSNRDEITDKYIDQIADTGAFVLGAAKDEVNEGELLSLLMTAWDLHLTDEIPKLLLNAFWDNLEAEIKKEM